MKTASISFFLLMVSTLIQTALCQVPTAWVNEFHYDNVGTDQGEFVEIVVEGFQYNLSAWSLVLYNGGNGTPYGTISGLGQAIPGDTLMNRRYFVFNLPVNGLQNGSPDGMALCYTDSLSVTHVLDLLSYEGSFLATSGPAQGMTLPDIGQAESNTNTPVGFSLQLSMDIQGSGWLPPDLASPGEPNANAALPVMFLSLSLENGVYGKELAWITASEINCSHFNAQVSEAGTSFKTIGSVPASGNSSMPNTYRIALSMPEMDACMRIEAVDFDGATTYSQLLPFMTDAGTECTVNISDGALTIDLEGAFEARIYTLTGALVGVYSAENSIRIPLTGQGVLILRVSSISGRGMTRMIAIR